MPKCCRHCKTPKSACFAHCHARPDGKHEADPRSGHQERDAPAFVVDFNCKHCGVSGSTVVEPTGIVWE